ncbi:MAG: hypothetical protein KA736_05705 [Crocinitomicaceae bacterium]|nr:hypothetical protein [Crocinitomicaceae bacterium]MBP6032010.1 hypothetical protein [Crocinitomicaceae bacterium]
MSRLVIFLLFFGFQSMAIGQTPVLVALEGTVQDFVSGQKLFGATVNVIQNGVSVSRVVSDNKGYYYVSAKVNPAQIVAVVVANPGYMTKKLSFDLKTIVPKANATNGVKLIDQLPLQLYVVRPNVDLAFTKETYAEKFVWDQVIYKAIPDAQVKADMDKKVRELYKIAKDKERTISCVAAADLAVSRKEYEKAVLYYDSALVVAPADAAITQKRKSVQTIIEINENEAKRKKEFDKLKGEGDAAFTASNWTLAEQKYKLADQQIPKDAYIVARLAKITENVNADKQNAANKAQYDKTMASANTLFIGKKYDEAIAKYNEAIKLQSNQKDVVLKEISKIQAIKEDNANELEVKKQLKSASDLYAQKKYDQSIDMYKKAELNIAKFKKQTLIDQYSKELQNGMKKVTDWKNSQDQIYKDQLAKANENFLKGPQFYAVAKNILNSDPMKSRQNEPSVIELKDKISKMEAYYAQRKAAYATVKAKNNAQGLKELKAVQVVATTNTRSLPATELAQLQKSIDSLTTITAPAVVKTAPSVKEDVFVGTQLKAPGERTNGTPEQAFNDLNKTSQQKAERPQEQLQEIKNVFDYQNHFNETMSAVQQESTDQNMESFKSEQTIIERKNQVAADQRQGDLQNELQKNEVAVTTRNKTQEEKQSQNAENISTWKDAKDVSNANEQKASDKLQESELSRSNRLSNEEAVRAEKLKKQEEKDLSAQEKMKTNYEVSVSKRENENAVNQDQQYEQIEKIAASKVELTNAPNNLKDEDGVLFPKNAMTERTYTVKNSQGFVTTVIVRRVVVDKNGYGVVFEQTTKEDGVNNFTRNGQIITDYIWFNESTGANVIEK